MSKEPEITIGEPMTVEQIEAAGPFAPKGDRWEQWKKANVTADTKLAWYSAVYGPRSARMGWATLRDGKPHLLYVVAIA